MPDIISRGNNPRLLEEGLNRVFNSTVKEHNKKWDKMYETSSSKRSFEIDQQFGNLSVATEKNEGDSVNFDTMQQGITPKYTHTTFSKGIIITRENLMDELYDVFDNKTRNLARSVSIAQEIDGANPYNNGFNPAFTQEGGDGKSLLATDHKLNALAPSTFSNKLAVAAALSEKSIEELLIQIAEAEDDRGNKFALQGRRLIIPPRLGFEAVRILKSVLQNDTANNAVNAIRTMGMLPDEMVVNPFLTSDTAWFIRTDAQNGMRYFTREDFSFQRDNDVVTTNQLFVAFARWKFGWSDPRGVYGTEGQ